MFDSAQTMHGASAILGPMLYRAQALRFSMSTTLYCYHCRTYHARDAMRLLVSKTGKRWRCIRSIELARRAVAEREAFGRRMSAINKAEIEEKTRKSSNPERFAGK